MSLESEAPGPWYSGISRYQWLVLVIASLGWVFDVFEGQIFVASMNEAMPSLLPSKTNLGDIFFYNQIVFGAFLVGGALGGVGFGMLSDRIGRARTMVYTILMYSLFTCLSALSRTWWHMALFRFLVALGVGGEWAVASSLVAEVFPKRARAHSLAIFHASSVLGTYLAIVAGAFINPNLGWRWGFGVGAAPALLTLWIRSGLREPDTWVHARAKAAHGAGQQPGNIADLFGQRFGRRLFVGVGLAAVGLATFWGTHIYGKDMLPKAIKAHRATLAAESMTGMRQLPAAPEALKRWEMLGMFLVTTGGGIGLISFGPICERLGRRGAFLLFQLGGLVTSLVLFQILSGVISVIVFLPIFGFLTLGMHAGYAIYFPELFPTRLRGTGSGFCFNVGRVLAAPILVFSGWAVNHPAWKLSPESFASLLSLLFPLGALLLILAPETKGSDLPE